MSAADRFVRDGTPDPERGPVDRQSWTADTVRGLIVDLTSILAVVAGTLAGAWTLAAWWVPAGPLLVLAVGLLGVRYSMRQAAEQREAARLRAEYQAQRRGPGGHDVPRYP